MIGPTKHLCLVNTFSDCSVDRSDVIYAIEERFSSMYSTYVRRLRRAAAELAGNGGGGGFVGVLKLSLGGGFALLPSESLDALREDDVVE